MRDPRRFHVRLALAVALALPFGGALLADPGEDPALAVASGRVTFRRYCASCHGEGATGDGPISQILTVPPADLTTMTARHGEFPADRIRATIDGREQVLAHGLRDMPVWGEIFQTPLVPGTGQEPGEPRAERLIQELLAYLRSIQRP